MATSRWMPAAAVLLSFLFPTVAAAQLPRQAPEFTVFLPGGQTLQLSQYKGHPVILAFILTTCSHCQNAVGILGKLQTEYAPRGLQVIASAIEENAPMAVPGFIRNFHPPFPVGYNRNDVAGEFFQAEGQLPSMPLIAFIDKQGVIRAKAQGEQPFFNDLEANLRKQIELLLKPAATPKAPSKK